MWLGLGLGAPCARGAAPHAARLIRVRVGVRGCLARVRGCLARVRLTPYPNPEPDPNPNPYPYRKQVARREAQLAHLEEQRWREEEAWP